VYSELGKLKIFPAKPDDWESGSISGILIRGNIEVTLLQWNGNHGSITLSTPLSQKISITLPNGTTKEYSLAKGADKLISW